MRWHTFVAAVVVMVRQVRVQVELHQLLLRVEQYLQLVETLSIKRLAQMIPLRLLVLPIAVLVLVVQTTEHRTISMQVLLLVTVRTLLLAQQLPQPQASLSPLVQQAQQGQQVQQAVRVMCGLSISYERTHSCPLPT
jgi:hypothetical protein